MAQAKKKTSTKTAKKSTSTKAKSTAAKKTCSRKNCTNSRERMHVYIVTALSMLAAIILCADAAIMLFC